MLQPDLLIPLPVPFPLKLACVSAVHRRITPLQLEPGLSCSPKTYGKPLVSENSPRTSLPISSWAGSSVKGLPSCTLLTFMSCCPLWFYFIFKFRFLSVSNPQLKVGSQALHVLLF